MERCRGLQGFANPVNLSRFLFSALLGVAPYCARGGIRVVSEVRGLPVPIPSQTSPRQEVSAMRGSGPRACYGVPRESSEARFSSHSLVLLKTRFANATGRAPRADLSGSHPSSPSPARRTTSRMKAVFASVYPIRSSWKRPDSSCLRRAYSSATPGCLRRYSRKRIWRSQNAASDLSTKCI